MYIVCFLIAECQGPAAEGAQLEERCEPLVEIVDDGSREKEKCRSCLGECGTGKSIGRDFSLFFLPW